MNNQTTDASREAFENIARSNGCSVERTQYENIYKSDWATGAWWGFRQALSTKQPMPLGEDSCERCVQLEAALREARDAIEEPYICLGKDYWPNKKDTWGRLQQALTTINAVLGEKAKDA